MKKHDFLHLRMDACGIQVIEANAALLRSEMTTPQLLISEWIAEAQKQERRDAERVARERAQEPRGDTPGAFGRTPANVI